MANFNGRCLLLAAALLLAMPAVSHAVREGDFQMAAQAGWSVLADQDVLADNAGFGGNLAYGLFDWLAFELDGLYSTHTEADESDTGELKLELARFGAGPRFTLGGRMVEGWADLLVGATWQRWEYKSLESEPDGDAIKEDDTSGSAALLPGAGVDFYISDMFQLGLAARYTWSFSTDEIRTDRGDRDLPATCFDILLRASLLF